MDELCTKEYMYTSLPLLLGSADELDGAPPAVSEIRNDDRVADGNDDYIGRRCTYMPQFKDYVSTDGGLEHLKRVSLARSLPSLHFIIISHSPQTRISERAHSERTTTTKDII